MKNIDKGNDSTQEPRNRASRRHRLHSDRVEPCPPVGTRRASYREWQSIKADYISGAGSLRELARQHSVSPSTMMKRAAREHWDAARKLTDSKTEAMVEATLQQRSEAFVKRVANQTDAFLVRIEESGDRLLPDDYRGLRQLAATLKDIASTGRTNYQLDERDPGVNLVVSMGFLRNDVNPLEEAEARMVEEDRLISCQPGLDQSPAFLPSGQADILPP